MDFDSSSKFISSLAKFLQSLCNGYVDFNNGVEVIGHIYINVDTGKKIDYVLNEKVCKTDENSVTFISNSFHAQPAEKPKQPDKTLKSSDNENARVSQEDEIIIMEEPESENIGTLPLHQQHQKARPSKRSQNFSSDHRQQSKVRRKNQFSGHNGSQFHTTDSIHSDNSSSKPLESHLQGNSILTAASDADMSHLSNVFPQPFSDPSNSDAAEVKDIKPQLDADLNVINVKQEYDPSQGGEEDQEGYDDSHGPGDYSGMQYDEYYGDGSQTDQSADYGHLGGTSQGDYYQGGAGMSGDGNAGESTVGEQDAMTDTSSNVIWKRFMGCPVETCPAKTSRFTASKLQRHWTATHRPMVLKYGCAICSFSTKRRSDFCKHADIKHAITGPEADSLMQEEIVFNKEYLDPYPYTLEMCLGAKFKLADEHAKSTEISHPDKNL